MIIDEDLEACTTCGELVDISMVYWVSIPGVPLCLNCWIENNGSD